MQKTIYFGVQVPVETGAREAHVKYAYGMPGLLASLNCVGQNAEFGEEDMLPPQDDSPAMWFGHLEFTFDDPPADVIAQVEAALNDLGAIVTETEEV